MAERKLGGPKRQAKALDSRIEYPERAKDYGEQLAPVYVPSGYEENIFLQGTMLGVSIKKICLVAKAPANIWAKIHMFSHMKYCRS